MNIRYPIYEGVYRILTMLTSFHPKTYFFWGKCFLLSEKTKVQPAQKPGFSVEKAFYCALFLLLSPEYERGL